MIILQLQSRQLIKASTFWKCQPFGSPLRLPMANDERMGAWLTRHSRQLVSSPSPYVVVSLLIFILTSVGLFMLKGVTFIVLYVSCFNCLLIYIYELFIDICLYCVLIEINNLFCLLVFSTHAVMRFV